MTRYQLSLYAVLCLLIGPAVLFAETFTNPIWRGQDPWMIKHGDTYYYCESGRNGISVRKSNSITERGRRKTVWRAPRDGWNQAMVWAPELHYIEGKWYIYYAASAGENESHRMGTLRAKTDDPQGDYEDMGMLYTGDQIETGKEHRWAIDGTVLQHKGKLYFIWSGWKDDRDIQYLYIAPMKNPWTISGNRVLLCENDTYVWERVLDDPKERGLLEGPQILEGPKKIFIVYSCSSSWDATYKLNWLVMDKDGDPLNPKSWKKKTKPAMKGKGKVYGVGHCSFVKSPDGKEDWIVYHTKVETTPGWNRVVYAQKFMWNKDGVPVFGEPVQPGEKVSVPGGQKRDKKD